MAEQKGVQQRRYFHSHSRGKLIIEKGNALAERLVAVFVTWETAQLTRKWYALIDLLG